jgi:DNA-binding NarL/FixJ family response regulator
MPPIQVLIVDDDDRFRQTIDAWPEFPEDVTVVGVTSGQQQVVSLIHEARPDLLLLGTGSLDTDSFTANLAQVHRRFPGLKIIVLHEAGQQDLVLEAFRVGAVGHLVKGTVQPDEVVEAIRAVERGDVVLNPRIAGSMVDEIVQRRLQENSVLS